MSDMNDQKSVRYPMPIFTPRLVLRPLLPEDGAVLYNDKEGVWESLSKVFEWTAHGLSLEADEAYVAKAYQDYLNGTDLSLVALERATGATALYTGLHDINRGKWNNIPPQEPGETKEFQIGFWATAAGQGKGYAEEASNALIRYAFNALAADRIRMCHSAVNKASPKILGKLGFTLDTVLKDSLHMAGGKIVDAHWYSMTSTTPLPELKVTWG